jgi:coenzyme F420-reducing hydrogenase alpha subunit
MKSPRKPADGAGDVRTIRVGALARVEGEGALHLTMRNGKVDQVRLEIYEPPRFFEAFLRGRSFMDVPDVTARICGICPVAYQMSSCHALEKALGVFDEVDPWVRAMRNLLYCGEWIESHVLHMFMLHLPDFLGYESVISMAADHAPTVKRALRIKKLGNDLVGALAGRSVHPVGVRVGGFYNAMIPERAGELLREAEFCLDEMIGLTMFLAEHVQYPDFERDYEFVALRSEHEYGMNLGRLVSNKGLDIDHAQFFDVFEERHVEHSTALHVLVKDRGAYHVGPLARVNLNHDKLLPPARELLAKVCGTIGKDLPWKNSFFSLPARGIETVHAIALAIDTLKNYQVPARSYVPTTPRAGSGAHATEAPRGILWQRYELGDDGSVLKAHIVPPTAQNQAQIELDLRAIADHVKDLNDDAACLRCEHLIRNYDPCISCSVHFLKFDRKWLDEHGTPL